MARSFNGVSDKIDADAAAIDLSGKAPFSISIWLKATVAQANALDPFAEARSTAAGPFFQLQGDASGKLVIAARGGSSGSADITTSTATVFDNAWHHVCVTQANQGVTLFIYVDGTEDHTFNRTILSNTVGQPFGTLSFGYIHRNTSSLFYGGELSEVALWTSQLTAPQVASLGAGLPASHLGPNHYWPLWGVDSPEPDIGNG